jgi:hypothetical protein
MKIFFTILNSILYSVADKLLDQFLSSPSGIYLSCLVGVYVMVDY